MSDEKIMFYSKLHNELIDRIGIDLDKYEREDGFFKIISDIDNGKDEREVFMEVFKNGYGAELKLGIYKMCYWKAEGY